LRAFVTPLAFAAVLVSAPGFAAPTDVVGRAQTVEALVEAFPDRAVAELLATLPDADALASPLRSRVYALYGRSLVLAGRGTEALAVAARLDAEAGANRDDLLAAAASLVRSNVQALTGDAANAEALATEARRLARDAPDAYLPFWAEMSVGVAARTRGRLEVSLESLQRALALGREAGNPIRTSSALYQLSVVYLALKQADRALAAALDAHAEARAAGSAFGMANARMAESAALELLEQPERELAALEDALAIAHAARSRNIESKALINLADIHLRRASFNTALALSLRSLALAREADDVGMVATSQANIGFALLGLGRVREGRPYADQALAYYEASGATAETATLLAEYGQYLERAGQYKAAADVYRRERRFNDEIARAAYEKTLRDMQQKYEAERRFREIGLLSRENDLKATELAHRELHQRVWWLVAFILATSFVVVAALYRKLRVTNRLLAGRNLELKIQSGRDPLTALYNRRHFQDFITAEGPPTERRRGASEETPTQALLLIDIDHFKDINDRHGHAAGDAVLVTVAQRLRETLRETDMIVRWGGEEFLVFVPATRLEELDEIASRIMHTVCAEPIACRDKSLRVTVSIGYAPMPLPPDGVALSWERAIGLVDMALYMAKVHGRNRAYGILGLRRADDASLAAVERDLEAAWRDGTVDLHALPGPIVPATVTRPARVAPAVRH
jgi:diguanylate cyclase (GGDEF)-like protein